MKRLINFELKKIFSNSFFKLTILLIIVSSLTIVIYNKDREYKDEFVYYSNAEKLAKNDSKLLYEIKANNKIYNYTLNHKTKYFNQSKKIMNYSYTLLMFLMVCLIILTSNAITSEYHDKTICLLLTLPYSKNKIYFSKLISIFIVTLLLSILLSLCFILFVCIYKGTNELLISDLLFQGNKIKKVSFFLNYYKKYFILLIPIYFIITLTFYISLKTKSSSVSSSISLIFSIFGMSMFTFLKKIKIKLVEYTFLPYLDFNVFFNRIDIVSYNIKYNINLSIVKGIIILLIYFILICIKIKNKCNKDLRI